MLPRECIEKFSSASNNADLPPLFGPTNTVKGEKLEGSVVMDDEILDSEFSYEHPVLPLSPSTPPRAGSPRYINHVPVDALRTPRAKD